MAKGTYQTYTAETTIEDYRADFIHRGAMASALSKRYPDLGLISTEASTILAQIDTRRDELQQAEDDQIRSRAIEDAEKFDVVEVYTELRRTMFAKKYDIATLLPDSPSILGRLGAKSFGARLDQAVANLKALPAQDPMKLVLLPALKQELDEFHQADIAEDKTREGLNSNKMALTLYKTELSQAREAHLGAILKIIGDSEKMALFTLPWRKASKAKAKDDEPAAPTTPVTPPPVS
ncbi:MAG: hypothetical protein ABI193_10640 [Minicystis sp.]